MRLVRPGSRPVGSRAAILLTLLAVAGVASPATAQSPSPAASRAALTERPMLAPEGWMFATVERQRGSGTRIDVLAVSPAGDIRHVAGIPGATRDTGAGRELGKAYEEWESTIATVTADGFLPVPMRWEDAAGVQLLVRLFDLLAPDPAATAFDLEQTPERPLAWDTLRSGADGRLSISVRREDGDANESQDGAMLLLDPLTSTTRALPPFGTGHTSRGPDWLADSSGWPAHVENTSGRLTDEGLFIPSSRRRPLVDLARGARQESASGRLLGTWDSGQGSRGFVRPEECRLWWSGPDLDAPTSKLTVWWDRCEDRGRVLDIRWDVDGVGVLVLVERRGRLELVRRDRPRAEEILASLPSSQLGTTRRDLRVMGLAPGPRPGELLLALQPADLSRSVFFLSTVEQELVEVVGWSASDSVSFAGFSVPPSDRDVSALSPISLRPPLVPEPMVAPDGWLLAALATVPEDPAPFDLTVIAMSPTGETRQVAVLPQVNRGGDWSIADVPGGQAVTTTGVLPLVLAGGDPDDLDPVVVRLFDLHHPDRSPIDLENTPGRVHDWTTLRSAPDGTLSVRIDDEGAFNGRHVIREIDPATGEERLLPYPSTIEPASDPLANGSGFPAWQDGQVGILRRSDGLFVDEGSRLVSLARGARQHSRRDIGLSRLVALQRPGDPDCVTDAIVSGPVDGPVRVWWDVCRDRGTLLDHRLDVDGKGLLFLVQRDGRIVLLRSDRPGRQEPIASVPTRFLGGREPIDRRRGLAALMEGPRPGELLLAFSTARGLWFWSTLEDRPVLLPVDGEGSRAWFAGFSVPPGAAR